MRSPILRLAGLGLVAGGLAWLGLRRPISSGAGSGPGGPERPAAVADPMPRAGDARGFRIVAACLAAGLLAAGAGLGWSAVRQRMQAGDAAVAMTAGEPSHAPGLMTRYGCGGCHTIPGVPGADGKVGPSLAGLRERVYVGGVARNTPANLVRWIVDPQSFSPRSAMPVTGISDAEARDVAAYLYAQ